MESATEKGPDFISTNIFDSETNIQRLISGTSVLTLDDSEINVSDFPITYAVYEKLLQVLDVNGYNIQLNLPKILLTLNADVNIPKKISNLTRKVVKDISKRSESDDFEVWKTTTVLRYLEQHVTEVAGFKVADLLEPCLSCQDEAVTVGTILRLRSFRKRNALPWHLARTWMKQLFGLTEEDLPSTASLQGQWDRLYNRKCREGKSFGEQTYTCTGPIQTTPGHTNSEIASLQKANTKLSQFLKKTESKLTAAQETVKIMTEAFEETSQSLMVETEKNSNLEQLEKVVEENKETISELRHNLSDYTPRNVRRREIRKEQKIDILKQQIQENSVELQALKDSNDDLKTIVDNQRVERTKMQKQLSYQKSKATERQKETDGEQEIEHLKQTVRIFENENQELTEKLNKAETFLQSVKTFQEGKYNDSVREVYSALLSMNVGVSNVEKIVRLVLEKMAHVKVDRLPKKTFAEMMLVEAKLLSQIQVADAMLDSSFNTIHMDGTKRSGQEFGGLQVGTDSGQYTVGVSELVTGDTESFLKLIKDQLRDISQLVDGENADKKTAEILNSVKNMMTDRHVVNSALKTKLEVWRKQCLPLIIENFETLPNNVRSKIIELNDFKCNLHVLVNFGSQSESGLKIWEHAALGDVNTTESAIPKTTSNFIRAATKLCVPGADEKSGYGLLFTTYLENLDNPVTSKLHSFHGHRINIIFSLGATVYFHHQQIAHFIQEYFEDAQKNKLVSAVESYVKTPVYLAGCRALGILDKLVTGPIWRHIEAAKHILDLNVMWTNLKDFMTEYSKDATDLLKGEVLFPDHTHVKEDDPVFEYLLQPCSDEMETLTREALEVLCLNFLIIIQRQLVDCLPGGKFHELSAVENLRQQSTTVKATNIVSERDFASLDRLQREKPNANTVALEGMILFSSNKTLQWLESLPEEKKHMVMESARKNAPDALQRYQERKCEIKRQRAVLLQQRREEKMKKEMDRYVHSKNEQNSLKAVKAQIRFRKVILKSKPDDKSLLSFSKDGQPFTLQVLKQNLLQLMNLKKEVISCRAPRPEATQIVIKTKEERDKFMLEHRQQILEKIKEIEEKQKKQKTDIREKAASVNVPRKISGMRRKRADKPDSPERVTSTATSGDQQLEQVDQRHSFVLGELVAIAFDNAWYPGNVTAVNGDRATVNFLHPTGTSYSRFKWPSTADISEVEAIFVIHSGFELLPCDNHGRLFKMTAEILKTIQTKFSQYKERYFE